VHFHPGGVPDRYLGIVDICSAAARASCEHLSGCPVGVKSLLSAECIRPASARCLQWCRPGSIGEGARFLNRQLSNRLFGKTGGLSQLFDFLSLLQYKVRAAIMPDGAPHSVDRAALTVSCAVDPSRRRIGYVRGYSAREPPSMEGICAKQHATQTLSKMQSPA